MTGDSTYITSIRRHVRISRAEGFIVDADAGTFLFGRVGWRLRQLALLLLGTGRHKSLTGVGTFGNGAWTFIVPTETLFKLVNNCIHGRPSLASAQRKQFALRSLRADGGCAVIVRLALVEACHLVTGNTTTFGASARVGLAGGVVEDVAGTVVLSVVGTHGLVAAVAFAGCTRAGARSCSRSAAAHVG